MATYYLETKNGINITVHSGNVIVKKPDFESPACSQIIEITISEWSEIKEFIDQQIAATNVEGK